MQDKSEGSLIKIEVSKQSVILAIKKYFVIFALLIISVFFSFPNLKNKLAQLTCNELNSIQKAKMATVKVQTEDSVASGFFISKNIVLTNNHVVEDINDIDAIDIIFSDGSSVKGKLIGWDNKTDIALIEVKNISASTDQLDWRTDDLKSGENLSVIGFPLSLIKPFKGEASVTKGVFSAKRKGLFGIDYIQTDAMINPGSSGGPIIDKCGLVIGVSDNKVKVDEDSETVFFGISAGNAEEASEKIKNNPTSSLPEGTLARFEEQDPLEIVKAYYAYINNSDLKNAFAKTFTVKRQNELNIEKWFQAFDGVTYIKIIKINKMQSKPIQVRVLLELYRTDKINNLLEETESTWTLKYNAGNLLLDKLEAKVISRKALFSQEIIDNFQKMKQNAETSYNAILSRNLTKYPSLLVVQVKALIDSNLAIANNLNDKVNSSIPLSDEDLVNLDQFIKNDNDIREIQRQFDQIDWNQYVKTLGWE